MRPDALWIPESMKSGPRIFERVNSICLIAERLLQVDYQGGERALIRRPAVHGRFFVTRTLTDSIYFPTGHPRSGQPRYRWTPGTDCIEIGYLVEGANG